MVRTHQASCGETSNDRTENIGIPVEHIGRPDPPQILNDLIGSADGCPKKERREKRVFTCTVKKSAKGQQREQAICRCMEVLISVTEPG